MHLVKSLSCAEHVTGNNHIPCLRMSLFLFKFFISQVHEIHPSHAFLVVPEHPLRVRSEPDLIDLANTLGDDGLGEQCNPLITISFHSFLTNVLIALTHPGVKCTQ